MTASTSSTPPISRFSVPEIATLPDDIRARIQEVQDKAGFVPNVFLALARRPDAFRAFFAYHDALMLRDGGLGNGEGAMLDFAMKVALRAHEIDDADYARLREHGFSDEDAWDIAAIAAFFAMSNRLANMSSMRPNDEFYVMGRLPKKPG